MSSQWAFSREPPHTWYRRLLWYVKIWRLTIQGQDPWAASCPPMIRMPPCRFCLNRIPQGPLRRDHRHCSSQGHPGASAAGGEGPEAGHRGSSHGVPSQLGQPQGEGPGDAAEQRCWGPCRDRWPGASGNVRWGGVFSGLEVTRWGQRGHRQLGQTKGPSSAGDGWAGEGASVGVKQVTLVEAQEGARGARSCRAGLGGRRRRAAQVEVTRGRSAGRGGGERSGLCVTGEKQGVSGIAGYPVGLGVYTWSGGPRGAA